MRNNRIRLSESQLHRVINDSIRGVLAEGKNDMLTLGNEALVMLHKFVRTKYPQMSQSRLNLEVEWLIGELYSRICDRQKVDLLNEYVGNSSANGYQFDYTTGDVQRNQGGAFGANSLDIARDREKYEKEQAARRAYYNCSDEVDRWYNQHYYDVVADFPGARSMTKQEVYDNFRSMY